MKPSISQQLSAFHEAKSMTLPLIALRDVVFIYVGILVGAREADDRFALEAVEHTRRVAVPREAGDVVAVGVGDDDVFEGAVGDVLLHVGGGRVRAAAGGTRVDEDVGVARLDVDAVSRAVVAQLHKVEGEVAARVCIAALRARDVAVDQKCRDKADREREDAAEYGERGAEFFGCHRLTLPVRLRLCGRDGDGAHELIVAPAEIVDGVGELVDAGGIGVEAGKVAAHDHLVGDVPAEG